MRIQRAFLIFGRVWPLLATLVAGVCIGYGIYHFNRGDIAESASAYHPASTSAGIKSIDQGLLIAPEQGDRMAEHRHDGDMARMDEETVYICPMNCIEPTHKPGKCPVCGMDLVPQKVEHHAFAPQEMPATTLSHGESPAAAVSMGPMHAEAPMLADATVNHPGMDRLQHQHGGMPAGDGPPILKLSAEMIEGAGIRVAPVEEKLVSTQIRLYGRIEYDPIDQYKVTAFAPGVVDNIYVRRAGQSVRRGDPLFDLHSAELYYLEQELLQTLKKLPYEFDLFPSRGSSRKRSGRWNKPIYPTQPGKDTEIDPELSKQVAQGIKHIRRKMRMLGLSEDDIDLVVRRAQPTGIATITTPMTGIVLEQNAFRGAFVNTGDVIFTIANPRVLWARLDAYASDFPWIRLGQKATFETDAYPGMTFEGKVVNIDPEFDARKRVFKVGVLFNDGSGLLKPNMLVRSVVQAELKSGGQGAAEVATTATMGTPQMRRNDAIPLVIPETAPLVTGERAVVYVQLPDHTGVYEGREVVLGPRAQGYYVVRSGLRKGELVVVNGNFKIDSAVQILARSSMMSKTGGPMPMENYDQVVTPPEEASREEALDSAPVPRGHGYQHNIYRGYRDRVK